MEAEKATWLALLDFLDEEISIHSVDGRILYANRCLRESSGEALDLLGQHCEDVFPAASCPYQEVLANKQPLRLEIEAEGNLKGRKVTLVPLPGDTPETGGFARIVARQNAIPSQDALLKAEHFATLGQMMSGIAHDVGTPLNIISGYAEYLLMRAKAEEASRKELMAILEQTRRVAEYIRIMLDLARPSQGRVDAIELKGFIADSLELMGSHLRKANVRVALSCNIPPPVLYGDGARLRQAFFNLVLNAGRRVGAGGQLELNIEQSPEMPGFVTVVLTGVGQNGEPQDYSQSFAGFLSPRRKWGSEDMGLALTKEILDEYGAQVTATPVNGHGVALIVHLPKGTGGMAISR
jgi:signal transduction histidine kinase